MDNNLLEIAELVFGDLRPTGRQVKNKHHRRLFECVCICGNICFVRFEHLNTGKTKSCGCRRIKHGAIKHPLYTLWRSMITRCTYASHKSYKQYGASGIIVCEDWKKDFNCFLEWSLESGWKEGLTLDRKENNKGYYPENCRWVTKVEQQRNKSNNVIIEAFGERKCIAAWVKDPRCVVSFNTISGRIKRKCNPEQSITNKKLIYSAK